MRVINTALLSYGMSGEVFHAPLLDAHPGFRLKAVVHRNPAKPIRHTYPKVNSIEEVLRDPNIELVIVNTQRFTFFAGCRSPEGR